MDYPCARHFSGSTKLISKTAIFFRQKAPAPRTDPRSFTVLAVILGHRRRDLRRNTGLLLDFDKPSSRATSGIYSHSSPIINSGGHDWFLGTDGTGDFGPLTAIDGYSRRPISGALSPARKGSVPIYSTGAAMEMHGRSRRGQSLSPVREPLRQALSGRIGGIQPPTLLLSSLDGRDRYAIGRFFASLDGLGS